MEDERHIWEVGLSSWIIQDGNYGDFETGKNVDFALEFYSQSFDKANKKTKSARSLGDAKYDITAEVIYLTEEVWVLDFGLRAFHDSKPPPGTIVGSFVTANIYLGIDPFFYFEELHALPGMLPLIYSWKVASIGQQTAPLIESLNASGQKALVRDATKHGYRTIGKTDGWEDGGGNAEYILFCAQLDVPPKFRRKTTT
jgi:hypothetical protein